ncbi:MAG TPA: hypothetical protein VMZ22_11385 [Acidimicrobiales bacterium]|nr:hypothetical protein [Acidimicrobiales bacterium]
MAKSILAFVAAVAMVLVAVTVRAAIDDDDSGGGGGGDASGPLRLVCASELRAVCDAVDQNETGLEVTIEAATTTVDRLKSVDPDKAEIDGWLAPGPWGEVVDAVRGSSAEKLFAKSRAPLARSPLVLAVWKDKRAALSCADPLSLGCVGDAVIMRGFRLGMAADEQAEGVIVDAALGAGHIKNADFATNDLNESDLSDWIAAVDTNVDRVTRNPGGRSFTELLTFGAAAADGYLSVEAFVGPQFAAAAKRGQLDLLYAEPAVTADVLFAAARGDRGNRLRAIVDGDRVREALAANGWRVPGVANIAGVKDAPRLRGDDGLPSAGVLQAVREVTK